MPLNSNSKSNTMRLSDEEPEEQLTAAASSVLGLPPVDELLQLLHKIEEILSKVEQSPAKSMQNALSAIMKALVIEELLGHSHVDVKAAVSSCISEITRITARDAPYDDEKMKTVEILKDSQKKDVRSSPSEEPVETGNSSDLQLLPSASPTHIGILPDESQSSKDSLAKKKEKGKETLVPEDCNRSFQSEERESAEQTVKILKDTQNTDVHEPVEAGKSWDLQLSASASPSHSNKLPDESRSSEDSLAMRKKKGKEKLVPENATSKWEHGSTSLHSEESEQRRSTRQPGSNNEKREEKDTKDTTQEREREERETRDKTGLQIVGRQQPPSTSEASETVSCEIVVVSTLFAVYFSIMGSILCFAMSDSSHRRCHKDRWVLPTFLAVFGGICLLVMALFWLRVAYKVQVLGLASVPEYLLKPVVHGLSLVLCLFVFGINLYLVNTGC